MPEIALYEQDAGMNLSVLLPGSLTVVSRRGRLMRYFVMIVERKSFHVIFSLKVLFEGY